MKPRNRGPKTLILQGILEFQPRNGVQQIPERFQRFPARENDSTQHGCNTHFGRFFFFKSPSRR